jgi:hypothetical protein
MDPSHGEMTATTLETPLNGEVLPPEASAASEAPATNYPIGKIDFNKPIMVFDRHGDEIGPGTVVLVLRSASYPVVVKFDEHGVDTIDQFDTDGDGSTGDYEIQQTWDETPGVVWGALLDDDGELVFSEDGPFKSEEQAKHMTSDDNVILIFPLTLPERSPAVAAAPAEDEEGDDDASDSSATLAPADPDAPVLELYVGGRTRRVGEQVNAYRNNYGTRPCEILKIRRVPSHKSLFIDPKDGNNPYWALNKNIRTW